MPQPITGYRELTAYEVEVVNAIKAHGEALGKLCDNIRGIPEHDGRWVAIGSTQLQQGLMALTRAVTRPTTF